MKKRSTKKDILYFLLYMGVILTLCICLPNEWWKCIVVPIVFLLLIYIGTQIGIGDWGYSEPKGDWYDDVHTMD